MKLSLVWQNDVETKNTNFFCNFSWKYQRNIFQNSLYPQIMHISSKNSFKRVIQYSSAIVSLYSVNDFSPQKMSQEREWSKWQKLTRLWQCITGVKSVVREKVIIFYFRWRSKSILNAIDMRRFTYTFYLQMTFE